MRSLAWLAIVVGCGAAQAVCAQTLSPSSDLMQAAFAPSYASGLYPAGRLMDRQAVNGAGAPVQWNTGELRISDPVGGPVDTVRVSVGGALYAPTGVLRPGQTRFDASTYEVAVIRQWPGVSFGNQLVDVDLSPHAGVGMSSYGGSLEAGATLKLSQHLSRDERTKAQLAAMGVADGAQLGGQGRWYLFAATSGRAVGINMMRTDSGWDRGGWTTDSTSGLISDAQVGVGWRKGALQTSVGYLHRQIKGAYHIWGQGSRGDSVLAFSLSMKPSR